MKKKKKNSQPQTKFTGSYEKRVYALKLLLFSNLQDPFFFSQDKTSK